MKADMYFETKRYLMSLISREYVQLRKKISRAYGFNADNAIYSSVIRDVNEGFFGKGFSREKEMINEYKEHYPKKDYTDYNFFDLESLNAFFHYLRNVNYLIDEYAVQKGGYFINQDVLVEAIRENAKYFVNNKNTSETGYYKGYATLEKVVENGKTLLNPMRTNSKKWDESKVLEYQQFLKEYFKDQEINASQTRKKESQRESVVTPPIKTTNASQQGDVEPQLDIFSPFYRRQVEELEKQNEKKSTEEPVVKHTQITPSKIVADEEKEELEDVYEPKYMIYKYKRHKLKFEIIKEEHYFDIQGNPIIMMTGCGESGVFIRTEDINGNIYVGELYDEDYNVVYLADESGEIFMPTYAFRVKNGGKSNEKIQDNAKQETDIQLSIDRDNVKEQ